MPANLASRHPFAPEQILRSKPDQESTIVLSSGQEIAVAPAQPEGAANQKAVWSVRRTDGSVRRMLHRWAAGAGWQMIWEAQRDFPVETDFQINGSFHQAVSLVMESLATSDFPLQASLNSHLKIVRITKYLQGSAQ